MSHEITNKVLKNFKGSATSDQLFDLSKFKGKKIILYFYPKDNTPGCTNESIEFQSLIDQFNAQNAVIFGISRDSLKSHEKFKAKYQFAFELISDEDEHICNIFDVIKEKNMYGKKYLGIERSTFLIDPEGLLVKEWRGVKVPGHVEEVYNFLCNL